MVARIQTEVARSAAGVLPGLVKSAEWVAGAPVTVITVGGVDFTNLPIAGSLSLVPGQTVNLIRVRGQLIVIGTASADVLPLQGTVAATGATTCQVLITYSTGVRTVTATFLKHYTPAAGQLVMLSWAYGVPVVLGQLSQELPSSLEPPYVPPAPPDGPKFGTETFTATDSGTLRGGPAWVPGQDLTASLNQSGSVGYWFYGTKIKSTMAGRVANPSPGMQPSIFLDVDGAKFGFDLFLHAAAGRNNVSSFSLANLPKFHITADRTKGWFGFPVEWATTLITSGGGLGVQPSGDSAYLIGIGENSQSGAIRIPWLLA